MPVSRIVPEHGSGFEAVAVRARAVTASDAYRNMRFMGFPFVDVIFCVWMFLIQYSVPGIRGEVPEIFKDNWILL
jgi:hypothetical protein